MKKLGFTLAELIMTLSIIGVTAALIAPAVTNIVPDAKKAKVLKYNSQLNSIVNGFFNDNDIYRPITRINPQTNDPDWFCANTFGVRGIACIDDFENLLREALNLDGNRSPDNSIWNFAGDTIGGYRISVDVDANREGCSYSNACNEPRQIDTFIFRINQDGAVRAGDALTDAYLKNPLKLTNREEDLDKAAELVNEINYAN